MSATDGAMLLIADALAEDTQLSAENGTGTGQHRSGVGGRVYRSTMAPRGAALPYILVFPQSSEEVTTQNGAPVLTNGVVQIQIVTEGTSERQGRYIASRVDTVMLAQVRRQLAYIDPELPDERYWISFVGKGREIPQPSETVADKRFNYRNLVYRSVGRRIPTPA